MLRILVRSTLPRHMFLWRNKKKYLFWFVWKKSVLSGAMKITIIGLDNWDNCVIYWERILLSH